VRHVRIARIITRLNIGGPSIQAVTLTERLSARGFDTLLIHGSLGDGEGDMRYLLAPSTRVEHVPALRRELAPASDAAAFARVSAILRDFKPHIVHTHMAKAGAVGRAAAAMYNRTVAREARARVVHTYHGHVLEGYFGAVKPRVCRNRATAGAAHGSDRRDLAGHPRRLLREPHRPRRTIPVVPLGFDLSALAAIDDVAGNPRGRRSAFRRMRVSCRRSGG
jgi:hypothetical protein